MTLLLGISRKNISLKGEKDMKKKFLRLVGVLLAFAMCVTMAPTATAKADEAVALSEYTEEQLLEAFLGEWSSERCTCIIEKGHLLVKDTWREEVNVDTDWSYEGVVELEGRVLTPEDIENVMNGDIRLEKVDGTWIDEEGNVYDEKDVTKTSGGIEGVYVEAVYESVVYEDGVWKDKTGNVYEEENVILGDFYIGEVLVTSREDGLREGSNGSVYEYIDGAWHEYLTDNVYERKDITPVDGIVRVSEDGWEKEGASVDYVDGAWKDYDGNVYAEEDLDYIYGKIEFNLDSKTKALQFIGGGYTFYLYEAYDYGAGCWALAIEKEDTDGGDTYYVNSKHEGEEEYVYIVKVLESIKSADINTEAGDADVTVPDETENTPADTTDSNTGDVKDTDAPVEDTTVEDKDAEATTGDTTDDTAKDADKDATKDTADKEETAVVKRTTDGREVLAGETVYVVKKGDCLWAIAEKLLGNGAKYRKLFTRNNGIIQRAELIFPGQEVIVPAQ